MIEDTQPVYIMREGYDEDSVTFTLRLAADLSNLTAVCAESGALLLRWSCLPKKNAKVGKLDSSLYPRKMRSAPSSKHFACM